MIAELLGPWVKPSWHVAGFVVFILETWLCVCFLISRCGWSAFAARYPARERPAGKAYNSPRMRFWFLLGNYRNAVSVIFTKEGIYFSVFFLFRPFHPPFLVPWRSVREVTKSLGLFLITRYRVDIKDEAGSMMVILPERAGEELHRLRNAAR